MGPPTGKGKGKGKDKGKSKGKGKTAGKSLALGVRRTLASKTFAKRPTEINPGYKGKRERIAPQRFIGKLIQWKGPFGWIVPDKPIDHPNAQKHGGRIYLDQIDVEEEISGVGAQVSFHVYNDGAGLGASNCIPARGKALVKTVPKPAGAASKGNHKEPEKVPDKANREVVSSETLLGVVLDWKGKVGWIKPDAPVDHKEVRTVGKRKGQLYCHTVDVEGETPLTGAQVSFSIYKDEHGLGAEGVKVLVQGDGEKPPAEEAGDVAMENGEPKVAPQATKTKGKGKGKGVERTIGKSKATKGKGKGKRSADGEDDAAAEDNGANDGGNATRERVVDEPIMGEVLSFRGRSGWIKATDKIDHPQARKHGGKVYVNKKDIMGDETLEKGTTVQFFVFKDARGNLGAEEVIVC